VDQMSCDRFALDQQPIHDYLDYHEPQNYWLKQGKGPFEM
jgi:hypothetical protein